MPNSKPKRSFVVSRVLDAGTGLIIAAVVFAAARGLISGDGGGGRPDDRILVAEVNEGHTRDDISRSALTLAEREALFGAQELGAAIGDLDGSVVMTIFGDFACGHCAAFAHVIDSALAMFPQHLQVRLVAFPLTSMRGAANMHMAAECLSSVDRFAEFYAIAGKDPSLSKYPAGWERVASSLHLHKDEMSDLIRCVKTRRHADLISDQVDFGRSLGVNATPTSFVGERRVIGAIPLAALADTVALELGRNRQ
jgi:protein-disulfide isomerase